MLKKLCVVLVGVALGLGLAGCSDNKPAQLPKEKVETPNAQPSQQVKQIQAPD